MKAKRVAREGSSGSGLTMISATVNDTKYRVSVAGRNSQVYLDTERGLRKVRGHQERLRVLKAVHRALAPDEKLPAD